MSCMCCLDSCTQLDGDVDVNDEPLVDIDRIIKRIAWEDLLSYPPTRLTCWEKLFPLNKVCRLEIDRAFLQVSPRGSLTFMSSGGPNGEVGLPRIEKGSTILFKSSFENNTDSAQTYSFRTERQTRSFVEMSLQRGFTVGQSLEVSCKIPTGPGGEDSSMPTLSGKLGGHLQWSFQRGKTSREEDQVTWSVDNNIVVAPTCIGTAELMVSEYKWSSDFTLPCEIRALPHPAPGHLAAGDVGRATAILGAKDARGGGVVRPGGMGKDYRRNGDGDPSGELDAGRGDDDDERDRRDEEDDDVIESEEIGVLTATRDGAKAAPAKVRTPKIPVFVRRKINGDMLKVIYVPCVKLVEACPKHFRQELKDPAAAVCDLTGKCHMVCAVEQRVRLNECTRAPLETPPVGSDSAPSYRDRYMR